jgi:hypothetical protein
LYRQPRAPTNTVTPLAPGDDPPPEAPDDEAMHDEE